MLIQEDIGVLFYLNLYYWLSFIQIESNAYTKTIQEAVLNRVLYFINIELDEIEKLLKNGQKEEAHTKFLDLDKNLEPIMKKNFKYRLNSLVHEFLEI